MSTATLNDTPDAAVPSTRARRTIRHPVNERNLERLALPAAWVVLLIVFSILLPTTFATAGNVQNILGSQAVLLIIAIGALIPFTAGEYDMSIASSMSLSAMTVSVLNVQLQVPVLVAALAGVAVGALCGMVNMLVIVKLRVFSLIATLGTGTLFLGLTYWISNSQTITGIDRSLSEATAATRWLFGVQPQFYYAIAITVIVALVLARTPYGRRLLFVGQGRQVAHLSGINVARVQASSFLLSGLIMGVAGVVYAGALNGSTPSAGQAFLMPALAACFLGSTAFTPGRFNAWGTFVAVYFLQTGVVGLQMLGARNYVQNIFYGAALVLAVALSQWIRRRGVSASRL